MEKGKSPECDGFPAEFYQLFWTDIADPYVNAINKAYREGISSITQRRGIISLLPKGRKSPLLLKNWRPMTLLNCDYKIAAKAIAFRVKNVLPKITNDDQPGFLKNRFIGDNIRLINDIIDFTEHKNLKGLLLFLDLEKAFDTIEWSFLYRALEKFNFGPSLIAWIKLFYTDTNSCIINWFSGFFNLKRGLRQGCPLSPYLFIVCVEILATVIRAETNIKGIRVGNEECKISQYADDSTLISDGSRQLLQSIFSVLDIFASVSSLKVNYEKTEAMWIGALKDSTNTMFPEKKNQVVF